MTQHQLILDWIQEHGSILPAKLYGTIYKGEMMGSELSKRCRELRKKGKLRSEKEGRFEKFYLNEPQTVFTPQEIFKPAILLMMNNKQGQLL